MSNLYKIESYCETSVKRIEECIRNSGGQCVVRGWAIITNYVFDDQQSSQILHLISKITDELSDDDVNTWSNYQLIAA
ncbi:hypothetical protein MACH09_05110 [Vibrio sp. MACH09]|uniref:hypothetical protein n=1 Tax=unclassified Vibrio TaxID=2614977 RepID=UPI00149392DC|nr:MULTISPECIES: hypothetical protein [unclassified Vibrio]NOI67237.1 hypothetical protein [Vibrio sp. 99-8-1]GLO60003.1 hypothetical protein MACH09_05110 [Vibrio sp. MACH09]